MIRIRVDVTRGDETLSLNGADGAPLLGPLTVFPPQMPVRSSHSSGPMGSDYRVELVPFRDAEPELIQQFGRYGLIVLRPFNVDRANNETGQELLICGASRWQSPEPSRTGMIRLSNTDFFTLFETLHRMKTELLVKLEWNDTPARSIASSTNIIQQEQLTLEPRVDLGKLVGELIKKTVRVSPFIAAAVPVSAMGQSCGCSPPSGPTPSAVHSDLLTMNEGGTALKGYVPRESSGVTVGAGFDLGMRTVQDLTSMGFESSLISKLTPYLTSSGASPVVGQMARAILAENPLTLTNAEAEIINQTYFGYYLACVASAFNRLSQVNGMTFSSLPAYVQTVLVDMSCVDSQFTSSKAFAVAVLGNWNQLVTALQKYKTTSARISRRAYRDSLFLSGWLSANVTSQEANT